MTIVTIPDGRNVDFGDMPMEQIKGLIQQKFPDHVKALSQPDRGAVDAGVSGIARGALMGFAPEVAGAVGGALDWAGLGPEGSKGTFSGGYKRTSDYARARDEAADVQHPYASTGGQVAGALGSAVALPGINLIKAPAAAAKTAPLITRAATAAARGAANVGNAAITGGAYGALQGAGNADDTSPAGRAEGAVKGAAIGGALGAVAPVVGAGLRAVGGALGHPIEAVKALWNPEQAAARDVVDAAIRDQGSVGGATRALQDMGQGGAPVSPLDLGETGRALGRRAANLSPEARDTLNQAVDARYATQFDRVSATLQQSAPGVNSPATRDMLEQAAAKANRPAYAQAYRDGEAGVWHEGLQQLTAAPAMQDAIRTATATGANKAAIEGFRPPQNPFQAAGDGTLVLKPSVKPTLQFWDNVKQNLDGMIGKAKRAGDDPYTRDLTRIKGQLVSYLDEAVPSYRAARQGAASFFGADTASEAGEKFAQMAGSPQMLHDAEQAIGKMKPVERQLFAEGYATQLMHDLSRVPDRNTIVNRIFNTPMARRQFELALGPQAARDMEATLRVEAVMDMGRRAVQGNSSTARQLIESGILGTGIGVATSGVDPFNPMTWLNPRTLITAALSTAAVRAGRAGIQGINAEVAKRVATMLTSSDPQVVRNAYRMISSNPKMMDALRRGQDRISRALTPVFTGGNRGVAQQLPSFALGPQPAAADQQNQEMGRPQ